MSRSSRVAALGAALLAAILVVACGVKGAPRPRDPNAEKKDPLADLPFRPPVERATSLDAGLQLSDGGVVDADAPPATGEVPPAPAADAGTP